MINLKFKALIVSLLSFGLYSPCLFAPEGGGSDEVKAFYERIATETAVAKKQKAPLDEKIKEKEDLATLHKNLAAEAMMPKAQREHEASAAQVQLDAKPLYAQREKLVATIETGSAVAHYKKHLVDENGSVDEKDPLHKHVKILADPEAKPAEKEAATQALYQEGVPLHSSHGTVGHKIGQSFIGQSRVGRFFGVPQITKRK